MLADDEADPSAAGDDDPATVVAPKDAASRRARRCPECGRPFSGEARFCPFDGDPLVEATDWNPAEDALIGQVVDGRYEVVRVLGEGGMGTVYEVRHAALGRAFALKALRREVAQDGGLTRRFIHEAKAAAAIGHPNIVAVTDFGELVEGPAGAGGGPPAPYFVMELLKGTSLASLLAVDGRLDPRRAAHIVGQCASALAAAHEAGVIHRDIKPDNVFLVAGAGRPDFVKLLDFGVAKIAGAGRLTRHGTVYGTPHYMSPEQAAGQEVDGRTDVYALGVLLYECLAGRVPFEADTYMGVLTKHLFATPEPIERLVPDSTSLGALGQVAARCLAKDPGDRYASMTELGRAIELAVEEPEEAAILSLRVGRPARSLRLREPSRPLPSRRREASRADEAHGLTPALRERLVSVGFGALLAITAAGLTGVMLRASSHGPRVATDATAAPVASAAPSASTAPSVAIAAATSAPTAVVLAEGAPAASVASAAAAARSGAGPVPRPRRAPERGGRPSPAPSRGSEVLDPWGP